jgi:hypothetical protein
VKHIRQEFSTRYSPKPTLDEMLEEFDLEMAVRNLSASGGRRSKPALMNERDFPLS